MSAFNDIIKSICQEENITFTKISKDWITVLEKDNQIHYIIGYKFDLNNNAISTILDDKYAFYELMAYKKNPIIPHHIIFRNYSPKMIEELYHKYNNDIVIKANKGSCGKQVFHSQNLSEIYQLIDDLLLKNYSLSICPFIDIKNEYRCIILDGNVELFYGKIRPTVIGDGHSTISELLQKFNPYYFSKKEYSNSRILEKDEVFEYNWQFNLSNGATIFLNIDSNLQTKLCKLAQKVANDIGIRFCSIDMAVDSNDNIYLMEANSGVMLENFANIHPEGRKIAQRIYRDAINKTFQK